MIATTDVRIMQGRSLAFVSHKAVWLSRLWKALLE